MEIIEFGMLAIAALVIIYVVYWLLNLRQIVDVKFADVVVRKSGTSIYSADGSLPEREDSAVYYNIPSWIPVYGCIVKRMPLEIMQIPIKNYETFAKSNARFLVDVSVYCRIISVKTAAQKFPGSSIEDFKKGMSAIIVSAVRKTTANYPIEDIISKRKEIADEIHAEIKDDFQKWGVELTNVAVENIADSPNATVIHDISAKKEAEINSLSRQEIAIKSKQAEIIEAENRELAEKRKIQADEQIAIRDQEKQKTVASMTQEAVTKKLEVERIEKVTRAEIDAKAGIQKAEGIKQASIISADGDKQSAILKADGDKQAIILKAEGQKEDLRLKGDGQASSTQAVGTAEANVIRSKKFAEAEGYMKLAEAQTAQQEGAERIRQIEKEERIGIALAEALGHAKVSFYGGGDPKNFMDLFKVGNSITTGGAVSTFLEIFKHESPEEYKKVAATLETIKQKVSSEASKLTPDGGSALPSVESAKKQTIDVTPTIMSEEPSFDGSVVEPTVNSNRYNIITDPSDGYPSKMEEKKRDKIARHFS